MEFKDVLLAIIAMVGLAFSTIYMSITLGMPVDLVALMLFTGILFVVMAFVLPFFSKDPSVRKSLETLRPAVFVIGIAVTLLVYSIRAKTAGTLNQSDLVSMFGESMLIGIIIAVIIVSLIGAWLAKKSPKPGYVSEFSY